MTFESNAQRATHASFSSAKTASARGPLIAALAALSTFCAPVAAGAQESATTGAESEESEEIVVRATRSNRRVQDEPIRVEVIRREEIEEKILMTPGNIATLVAETGGVRVQVTSPALGASNVRMQGMNGRYTSLLADGLPLYGGQSIGLLQIPPTDLGQVEVIKGAASALYGPSALGGVINLVSRRPSAEPQGEVLANATSRNGQDLTAYGATPLNESFSASMTGGYHRQSEHDLDGDGWLDIAGYERWTARPRLYWEGDSGANGFVTVGAMTEQRTGGTRAGRTAPDGLPFVQSQDARRLDAGAILELPIANVGTASFRGAAINQDHEHRFGDVIEDDRHRTLFAEVSLGGEEGRANWLTGIAFQSDQYRSDAFADFDYTYDVPGVFAQLEYEAADDLILAASARADSHSEFGEFFSPRVSALYKPGGWTMRASLGQGFYAPTPFVEEIEAAGLSRLAPLNGLDAETATTASLDVGYRRGPWEANMTLFASDIDDAVRLVETGANTGGTGDVAIVNADGVTRTRGVELLLRYRWDAFTFTGSYVYVDASEPNGAGGRRTTPVTPRQTAGFVAMWEEHGRGRLGFEAYYTGKQSLDDNPYRTESKPYVEIGLLGEITRGDLSFFLNGENLLNVRQTDYDSLLRQTRAVDGRWTVDAWAPLEGATINGGVRWRFGGH